MVRYNINILAEKVQTKSSESVWIKRLAARIIFEPLFLFYFLTTYSQIGNVKFFLFWSCRLYTTAGLYKYDSAFNCIYKNKFLKKIEVEVNR
jgi:hypothetical protein